MTVLLFIVFSCIIVQCIGKLGASTAVQTLDESESSEFSDDIDLSDVTSFNSFVRSDLLKQAWVTKYKSEKDPLSAYTFSELFQARSIVKITPGIAFDIVDRETGRGYRTVANDLFSSPQELFQWYASQPPTFQARYAFLLPPVSLTSGFLLASPGLKFGQYRKETIGGVIWTEVSSVERIVTFPVCEPNTLYKFPPQPPTNRVFSFIYLVRSLKVFFNQGSQTTHVIDSKGNTWYMGARRGPNPPQALLPPGFTISDIVIPEDIEVTCFSSNEVPSNKDGDDNIVCKQLQMTDFAGNTYLPVKISSKTPNLPIPFLSGGPSGAPNLIQCAEESITESVLN